jgi:hypothetical protein
MRTARTTRISGITIRGWGGKGTRGYIGRIEIRTDNEYGITVTLDQLDGRLSELYVNAVDLRDDGSRPFPDRWGELAHIVEPM